jgi:hypothetical protein
MTVGDLLYRGEDEMTQQNIQRIKGCSQKAAIASVRAIDVCR